MIILMRNKFKYIASFVITFLVLALQPAWAEGPPAPSIFNNALALSLLALMVLLLIVIGILGNILIGAADINAKKRKSENKSGIITGLIYSFIFSRSICPK